MSDLTGNKWNDPLGSQEARDRARRAVAAFAPAIPGLTALARGMTGNERTQVKMNPGGSYTDGKNIYLRAPIEMADVARAQHRRSQCGKRDKHTLEQLCDVCAAWDDVNVDVSHEIGHIVQESFGSMDSDDAEEALEAALRQIGAKAGGKLAERAKKNWSLYAPTSYIAAARLVSPYMPMLVNALEDTRVNLACIKAAPGLKTMFDVQVRRLMDEGLERPDGTISYWHEAPLASQLFLGLHFLTSGYDVRDFLTDEACDVLDDDEIQRMIRAFKRVNTIGQVFKASVAFLERFQELGHCRLEMPEEPEQDDDEETAPGGEPEQSDDEDGDDDDQAEDDSDAGESEKSDDTSSSDDGDSQDDGDGDDAEDGSGAGEGDEPDDDSEAGEGDGPGDSGSESTLDGDEPDEGSSESSGGQGSTGEGSGTQGVDPKAGGSVGDEPGADEPEPEPAGASDEPGADEPPSGPATGSGDEPGADEPEPGADDATGDTADEPGADDGSQDSEDDGDDGRGQGSGGDDAEYGPPNPHPDGSPQEVERDLDAASRHGKLGTEPKKLGDDEAGSNADADKARGSRPGGGAGGTGTADDTSELTPEQIEELVKEIDRAIAQFVCFDEPSVEIYGVTEHRWGVPSHWGDRYSPWYSELRPMPAPPELVMAPALQAMRRTFNENQRAKMQRNLKRGKVNARVLATRVPAGDNRLFQKSKLPGKRDYFVLIGGDVSGSTAGPTVELIKSAMLAQAELLHRLGIKFAVYAHTATAHVSDDEYAITMDVALVKEPHEKWTDETRGRLGALHAGSGNLDGHTFEYYRKQCQKVNATDKLVLYYTDGAMPAANYEEELYVLQREIADAKKYGITYVGVGVGTDSPTQHGLDTIQLDSLEDVPNVVRALEKRLK